MSRQTKNMKVLGLISVLVIAVVMAIAGASQGLEGDHDGDIVVSITVLDGRDPVEEAEVDVYNSTGDLVDAGLTDENGTWIFATNQSLEDSEIKVYHEDHMDEAQIEDINISLPEDENETVYESLTINIGTDYVEDGREYYRENQAIVLGGGILFLAVILVVVNRKRIGKKW